MPTYQYECGKTRQRFELVQNMSDDPMTQCPEWGGVARRLIGTGEAIVFKATVSTPRTTGNSPRQVQCVAAAGHAVDVTSGAEPVHVTDRRVRAIRRGARSRSTDAGKTG